MPANSRNFIVIIHSRYVLDTPMLVFILHAWSVLAPLSFYHRIISDPNEHPSDILSDQLLKIILSPGCTTKLTPVRRKSKEQEEKT